MPLSQREQLRPTDAPRPAVSDGKGLIESAYELFASQRDGVLKVAITP